MNLDLYPRQPNGEIKPDFVLPSAEGSAVYPDDMRPGKAEGVEYDHTHHTEEGVRLRFLDEVKLEAAERAPATAKTMEMQAACGCGTCPQCISITVWNVGSLVIPAIKVASRRFRNRKNEPKELPSLSEREPDFVMRSFEATMPMPAPKRMTGEEIAQAVVEHGRSADK